MISEEAINTITKAIKFKYDEHVGRLLSIPEVHLKKIIPNRGLPIIEMLEGFNADTASELRKYGEDLKAEIVRLIERLKPSTFSEEDKKTILGLVENYCTPGIYKNRFDIMLGSIDRKARSYGIKLNLENYRIDIPKSCCVADAENTTRRIKAIISNELTCLVESYKSQNSALKDVGSQKDKVQSLFLFIFKKIWSDPVLSKVIAAIILIIGGLFWAWLYHGADVKQITPSLKHASSAMPPSNSGTNNPSVSNPINYKNKEAQLKPAEIAKDLDISLLLKELNNKGLLNDLEAAELFLVAQTENSATSALERYEKVIRSLSFDARSQLDHTLLERAISDEERKHLDDAAAKYRALFSGVLVRYHHYQKEANR